MIAVIRRLLLAAALLLAACNSGFQPQFLVTDVRILAVRDSAPGFDPDSPSTADVAPGDPFVLEALVANPLLRPGLTVGWFACLPPASDALTPCDDRTFLEDPSRLTTEPAIVPLGLNVFPSAGPDPSVVASISAPLTDPATATTLAAALRFALDVAAAGNGYECRLYAELPVIVLAEAGGVRSLALKRVRIASAAANAAHDPPLPGPAVTFTTNANPVVTDVLRASPDPDACTTGASLSSPPFPAGRTPLCGAADAPQPFSVCDPDPRLVGESQSWQWYATAGDFPDESGGVGNATGQNVDFTRPATAFSLWAIVRDGRGGTGWTRWDLGGAP